MLNFKKRRVQRFGIKFAKVNNCFGICRGGKEMNNKYKRLPTFSSKRSI